uniref:Regulator of chromosome condensation protein n=1 Tax=Pithovirus LCPAC401 TaxID=2506595 RepID=A0A481ZAM1_9VIRU|nr:MAG: regulator of chromosome condensation protein [Pithovirus LCPAC401]
MSTSKIASAGFSSFAFNSKGEIQGFGSNEFSLIEDIPKGSGYKYISAEFHYVLAINSNNEIVGWGSLTEYKEDCFDDPIYGSDYLVPNPQVAGIVKRSDYVSVSAGYAYVLALTSNGEIISWGNNSHLSKCKIPEGSDFVEVSAGTNFAMALRSNGKIESWGLDLNQQVSNTPTDLEYIAISANQGNPAALRRDGTIICWGDNKCNTPTNSGYVAISASDHHALALKNDGSLVSWGNNQIFPIPKGTNFVAISTELGYSVALDDEEKIIIWGKLDNKNVNKSYTLS